jgi:flagellar hook assembly protein FlgD
VKFSLLQNYPNPFNSITQIDFDLPGTANLELQIFDMNGKLVKTLADGEACEPGNHIVQWNGTNDCGAAVSSGIYVCRLMANELNKSTKLVLLK